MAESASYRIKHQTTYRYSDPVAICQNQLRMTPRSMAETLAQVQCRIVNVHIDPSPDFIERHEDYFGNLVYSFSIETLHNQLDVVINSEVTVVRQPVAAPLESIAWDDVVREIQSSVDPSWYEVQEYCLDSPRVRRHERFADFARPSFPAGRGAIESVLELTKRIHDEFAYDRTLTDVDTSTERAFELKAGVCQDFTHVIIACLRSLGIPARYVSGYLRTVPKDGQARLVGADESHAWVSVFLGHQIGWMEFDPTNACRCDTNHIPICLGRDYSEVSPMRGVVLGGGKPQLNVSVDVELIDSQ